MYFCKMINFLDILGRIKEISGLKRDNQVAALLKISPSQISNIKRAAEGIVTTGSQEKNPPFRQLIEWAEVNSIDLNYLFFGEAKQPIPARLQDPAPEVACYLDKTREILESGTSTAEALKSNIIEFHRFVSGSPPKETPAKPKENNPAARRGRKAAGGAG